MKHERIELNEETDIFEAEITLVNTNKLLQMLPDLNLGNNGEEYIVKKHKDHLEFIPF